MGYWLPYFYLNVLTFVSISIFISGISYRRITVVNLFKCFFLHLEYFHVTHLIFLGITSIADVLKHVNKHA